MRIGIDARKIGDYGIGTYIRGLLGGLADLGGPDRYIVFAPASARALVPATFEHVVVEAPHYSFRELVVIRRAIDRAGVDLFHAPHYVVPFTKCPTVVTIHDLIHLNQKLANRLAPLYARVMIGRAVRKSVRILTVSETVKRQIVLRFRCREDKIAVTPNGVDPLFRAAEPTRSPARYFLYVGNDKPHKNVGALIEAFQIVQKKAGPVSLVLAGARFRRFAAHEGVITPGFVSTGELGSLYRNALAVVLPSVEEGFGLPALEAMSSGAAVITSLAEALVEVTGDAALHVDATSPSALADAMLRVAVDDALRIELASGGIDRARSFTWRECAEKTRRAYDDAIASSRR
ncbi:MAG TPA: glycosyltransferase family 1 protein [Thermoanaerobaculia bacterium]|nr:glycosyltransferase family 1 protein [Thermoanaerobaculia bacterium]